MSEHEPSHVLVLSLPKTASTTLAQALEARFATATVWHTHSLDARYLGVIDSSLRSRGFTPGRIIADGLAAGEALRSSPHEPVPVVTVVRDPLHCWVSAYFQNLHRIMEVIEHDGASAVLSTLERGGAVEKLDPADLLLGRQAIIDGFDWYATSEWRWPDPTGWMEDNVADALAIDLLSRSQAGEAAQRFVSDVADLLVLRFEDLAQTVPARLADHFGVDSWPVPARNVGASKPYASWRTWLEESRDFAAESERLHGSRYARAFWTSLEIDAMRRRWSGVNA